MIYKETARSRAGEQVPLFLDGTPMHSLYNASKECATFGSTISSDSGCIVIAGVGGGFHINSLRVLFPHAKLICCEADEQSLCFCKTLDLVKTLLSEEQIFFCTVAELGSVLVAQYLPALDNGFAFISNRIWGEKNKQSLDLIIEAVQRSLKQISADYSVQKHFGKIWQRNILLNSSFLSRNACGLSLPDAIHADTGKKAAVIAAGPSFDKTVSELIHHRDAYVIISTDTAYGALLLRGLVPEVVVSVDGQSVSSTHFSICPDRTDKFPDTIFVFDLCASPDAAAYVSSKGYRTFFIQSGHPLSRIVASFTTLPTVDTGSGTVTIACCDIARMLGFKTISLFGADFSYSAGKPYTRGTYLDRRFYSEQTKWTPAENSFDHLLFRTPLKQLAEHSLFSGPLVRPFTTEVLESYGKTLLAWADRTHFTHDANELHAPYDKAAKTDTAAQEPFDTNAVTSLLIDGLAGYTLPNASFTRRTPAFYAVLPYLAWLKGNDSSLEELPLFELYKLAYSALLHYTKAS